ncbi:MAG TPA: exosortase system-associated protein, TIGR04073 family [Methylomirabilota bacterium]|nr:exosortase system-associated protein, TIGR04073 family [Methylomirabilota bacterium]
MRIVRVLITAGAAGLLAGCAGPEEKFGRGLRNLTEFARLGEIQRSIEQTSLWDGPAQGATTGFIRGFNRSMARTGIGLYEVVTAPFPGYGPIAAPKARLFPDPSIQTTRYPYGGLALTENPMHPASHTPGFRASSIFETDRALGFSGGDVLPMVPGNRFRVFE